MLGLIRLFLGSLVALVRSRAEIVAENLALRHQLGILLRMRPGRLPLYEKGTGKLCRMDRTASAGIAGTAESTVPERTQKEPPSGQNATLAGWGRDSG